MQLSSSTCFWLVLEGTGSMYNKGRFQHATRDKATKMGEFVVIRVAGHVSPQEACKASKGLDEHVWDVKDMQHLSGRSRSLKLKTS